MWYARAVQQDLMELYPKDRDRIPDSRVLKTAAGDPADDETKPEIEAV
ncbi:MULTISPECIES: hypothetical protein [unclassified Nitrobacter]|nr:MULTISPECIES: hypothetical protein [unclassified Nitrobacter]MBN9148402.1 hypothetical protein [Nitrobacter sp.]